MKLFLLTLASLLFVGSYGNKLTGVSCTTSTGCSGSDCTTASASIPSGCNDMTIQVCEDGWYNSSTYATSDCSGDPTITLTFKTGTCYDLSSIGGSGSVRYTCSDAKVLSVLFIGILVIIMSLFQ